MSSRKSELDTYLVPLVSLDPRKNVKKSEHWPKCHKFRSKVKNYKNGTVTKMSHILIKGQKVTKSEQWPKRRIFWSKFKKLQNVINDQNVQNSDQLSESYEMWTMAKMSNVVIKKKVTISEQWAKCHLFWSKDKKLQNLSKD